MKTPKDDRTAIRTELVVLRMTPNEKKELQEAADAKGLLNAAYIRMLIKQDIERGGK